MVGPCGALRSPSDGDQIDRRSRVRPQGEAPPTADGRPAGASDLLGNLREWTATSLKPYPYRHDDGRAPFAGSGRVGGGGASHDHPVDALSLRRRRAYERRRAAGHHVVGLRCAMSDDLGEMAPGGRR